MSEFMVSERSDPNPSIDELRDLIHRGSFEDVLRGLEQVVALLERGRLSIEEAVDWYELGLGLTRRSTELLDQAELRVRTLEETHGLGASGFDALESHDGS